MNELNLTLAVNEVYALSSTIMLLDGLTRTICKDFDVDNIELLQKLSSVTDAYVRSKYPVTDQQAG